MEGDRQGDNTTPTGGFEAPDPAELSRLLAGYEVSQLIACGGMGAVYVARQKSLDRDVAIKILPPEFGKDPQFRAGFEAEAKAMARLNHPNLIAVYDFGEVDEFLYIIMEMVKGKSLHHSAHGKAIDQREVARLIHGICRGLAHAHEAGIIHRDIKPANILLSPNKDPKIGDFGLARPIDDAKGDGMHFGTPGYTAPEVMKDPAKADERSDVFATGVILYELLTGGLPGKTYVPASQGGTGIDPRFDRIVRRAMHPAPAMRFADARAMADAVGDLKEALGESGAGSLKTGTRSVRTGDPESGKAAASPAAMQTPIDPYRGLASKLAIIVVLLGAIFGLWNLYVKEKARRDRINTELANKKPGPVLPPIPKPPKPPVPVPKPEPEPEPAPPPETPLEALTRLQNALAGGERGRFPPGTHERDGSWYFLVEDSMDWWEACRFAEEHGGHLATLANGEEQAWLAGQIPGGTTVWLGGVSSGGKEWGWIDGSKWVVAAPYTSTLSFACLSEHGKLLAKTRGQQFPFFICWHAGGENPGSLASQLERLRGSLEGPDPIYPPGTLTHGSGRYLVIEQPTTWSAAARIATNAGGHLAVPSDKTESDFLHDAVTSALPEGGAAWIGGRHDGSKWTWTTGESMSFGDWRANAPDGDEAEETALRLVGGPGGGWDDANPLNDAATSALVVEWSEGRKAPVVPVPPVQPNDWAELRQRAVDLVAKEQAKFAAGILKNGDGLTRDLDAYFFKLDRANRARFGPAFAGAKAMVTPEGRIVMPALKSTIRPLPPGGATIFDHYFRGQETLETDNERALKNVHHHYVKQLAEKRDEARELGLTTEVRAIENEIDACGSDGQALLEHLAPEPQ